MNKQFLQQLAVDALLWLGIIWGLYLGQPLVENMAVFALWAWAVLGVLTGLMMMETTEDDLVRKAGARVAGRSALHQKYIYVSIVAEVLALAGLGHFWLAGCYLVAGLLSCSGSERMKRKHQEAAPC